MSNSTPSACRPEMKRRPTMSRALTEPITAMSATELPEQPLVAGRIARSITLWLMRTSAIAAACDAPRGRSRPRGTSGKGRRNPSRRANVCRCGCFARPQVTQRRVYPRPSRPLLSCTGGSSARIRPQFLRRARPRGDRRARAARSLGPGGCSTSTPTGTTTVPSSRSSGRDTSSSRRSPPGYRRLRSGSIFAGTRERTRGSAPRTSSRSCRCGPRTSRRRAKRRSPSPTGSATSSSCRSSFTAA